MQVEKMYARGRLEHSRLIFENLFCKNLKNACGKPANANENGELPVPRTSWDSLGQWDGYFIPKLLILRYRWLRSTPMSSAAFDTLPLNSASLCWMNSRW